MKTQEQKDLARWLSHYCPHCASKDHTILGEPYWTIFRNAAMVETEARCDKCNARWLERFRVPMYAERKRMITEQTGAEKLKIKSRAVLPQKSHVKQVGAPPATKP